MLKDGYRIKFTDLPGIYSLFAYSPEEAVSRNYLLKEKPDVVLNIIDSSALERNLYLSTQLIEMNLPIIFVFNMFDSLKNKTDYDLELLSKLLGGPIAGTIGNQGKGIKELPGIIIDFYNEISDRKKTRINYHDEIENEIDVYKRQVPGSEQQAVRIVENFEWRRKQDPDAGLICGIPFHGVFSAAVDLNYAYLYVEVAETNCKILINRQIMFGNNPKADFSIHHDISREEISTIAQSKEVCPSGLRYRDAFGRETTYQSNKDNGQTFSEKRNTEISEDMVSKITNEVLRKIKRD